MFVFEKTFVILQNNYAYPYDKLFEKSNPICFS